MTALLICAALFLAAANLPVDPGLTVHEWGTFTSVAGENGSPVDWNTLGCKDDLPSFVKNHGFRNAKAALAGTIRMETPVMYFYSRHDLDARVKVSFPNGLITEWYPAAEYEVFQRRSDGSQARLLPNLNGFSTYLTNQTGTIEWKNIKVQPGASPELPIESAP